MGASGLFQWRLQMLLMAIVFPIALGVYACSGCDLRKRSEKHACEDGSGAQCLVVGKFYEARTDGLFGFLLSNAVTAKRYYHRGCVAGNLDCCAHFGHMIVNGAYDSARDDDFNHGQGMNALKKACDGGQSDACRELADASDPADAAPILEKLCKGGDKASCDKLESVYEAIDPKRANDFVAKRCDGGEAEACRELGKTLLAGSNDDELTRGTTMLAKACDMQSWDACRELAEAYLDGTLAEDPARAAELCTKGCDAGDGADCYELGKAQLSIDPATALATFTRMCDHSDPFACDALGDLYRVGTSATPRDRQRALAYYDKVCRNSWDFGCAKRNCMNGDADWCYKNHQFERKRWFKLGPEFEMR